MMHERGGDPKKLKKYIAGIYSMLEELEECCEEMCDSYGERDDYDFGERRSHRSGRYMR